VFTTGIQLLKEQPALAILAGLNVFVIAVVQQIVNGVFSAGDLALELSGNISPELSGVLSNMGSLFTLPFFVILNTLVFAGAYVAFANYIRNDEVSFGALYTSIVPALKSLVYQLLLTCLLTAILTVGILPGLGLLFVSPTVGGIVLVLGVLLSLIPTIYVSLGFMLGIFAVVLDDAGIIEAFGISWRAASGARVDLFILSLVFGLLGIIASCCCIFPVILVSAIQLPGMTAAWMKYARAESASEEWTFFKRLDEQS
jgi:hypothetical protein